jgi:hypothetical protein
VKDLSLLHSVQTGSGARLASYPIDTGGSFPGLKLPGREADYSPANSAEAMNGGAIPSTTPYVFLAWCLNTVIKHRDNFKYYLYYYYYYCCYCYLLRYVDYDKL